MHRPHENTAWRVRTKITITGWAVCQCSDSHCCWKLNIHCRKGYNKAWKVKRKRNIRFAAKLMCETHSKGPRAVQDERLSNTRYAKFLGTVRWTLNTPCVLYARLQKGSGHGHTTPHCRNYRVRNSYSDLETSIWLQRRPTGVEVIMNTTVAFLVPQNAEHC